MLIFNSVPGIPKVQIARLEEFRRLCLDIVFSLRNPVVPAGYLPEAQMKSNANEGFQRDGIDNNSPAGIDLGSHHVRGARVDWLDRGRLELGQFRVRDWGCALGRKSLRARNRAKNKDQLQQGREHQSLP